MVDARASRDVADDADRSILGGPGGAWLDERLRGDTGHLIVATTLPFLLPRAVHHLEGWNEALCAGAWGGRLRGFAERLRRALDLEHWAAFRRSFDAVAGALVQVAAGERGTPPATALLLSGDVHFSYLARARPSRAAGGAAGGLAARPAPRGRGGHGPGPVGRRRALPAHLGAGRGPVVRQRRGDAAPRRRPRRGALVLRRPGPRLRLPAAGGRPGARPHASGASLSPLEVGEGPCGPHGGRPA